MPTITSDDLGSDFGFPNENGDTNGVDGGYLDVGAEEDWDDSSVAAESDDGLYGNTLGVDVVYGATGLPALKDAPSDGGDLYQKLTAVEGAHRASDGGSDTSGYSSSHAILLSLGLSLKQVNDYQQSASFLYCRMLRVLAPAVDAKDYLQFLNQVKTAFDLGTEDALAGQNSDYAQYIAFQKLWRRSGSDKGFTRDEARALLTWLDKMGFAFTVPVVHQSDLLLMTDGELQSSYDLHKTNPAFVNPQYGAPLKPDTVGEAGYMAVDDTILPFEECVVMESYLTKDGQVARRPKQQETRFTTAPVYDLGGVQGASTDDDDGVYALAGVGGEVPRRGATLCSKPAASAGPLYDMGNGDGPDAIYDLGSALPLGAPPVPWRSAASPNQADYVAPSAAASAAYAAAKAQQGANYAEVAPAVPGRRLPVDGGRTYLMPSAVAQEDIYAELPDGDAPQSSFQIAIAPAKQRKKSYDALLVKLIEQLRDITLPHQNFVQRHPKAMIAATLALLAAAGGAVAASMGSGGAGSPSPEASCDNSTPLLEMCALVVREAGMYVATQSGLTISAANLVALYETTKNTTFLLAAGFSTFTPAIIHAYKACNETALDALCRSPDWVESLDQLLLDEDIDFFFDDDAVVMPEDGFVAVASAVGVNVDGGRATQLVVTNLNNCALYREVDGVKTQVDPVDGKVIIPAAVLSEYFFGSHEADYFGPASYQIEVDAVSDVSDEIALRSDPQVRSLSFTPLADTVTHTGTAAFTGIETDFFELDTRFQLAADNEQLLSRLITGPAGMVVEQDVGGEWQAVPVVKGVATVGPSNAVRVMLPPGEHAMVVNPCVDYGALEPACDLDSAVVAVSVNFAPPSIRQFTASPIAWVEGQQRAMTDIVAGIQVTILKGTVSDYVFSALDDIEIIDTRTDSVLAPVDGLRVIPKAEVSHYAVRATASDFYGEVSLAVQVRVAGLDGSTLDSITEVIQATVDPILGLITSQGNLNYSGVSDQYVVLNNTFTASEAGETVLGRRLTGLTAAMQVEAFGDDAWQAVMIRAGEADLSATGNVRVMLPPGEHDLKLYPCVDYGAAQPSCLQYPVELSFDVAHPAPVVNFACPDDILFVEDGMVRCDDIYAAMAPTSEHANITTLQLSSMSESLRVLDAQGQLVTPTQGVYVLPVDDLSDYRLTTTLNAYGEMTYEVALGVTSFNGQSTVADAKLCTFDVAPAIDDVSVAGNTAISGYHTLSHVFDVNFTVVDGEILMARELRNLTASMTVEVQAEADTWQAIDVVNGTVALPAEGSFRVSAPEGKHALNIVPCVDIGNGSISCDYPPTVLDLNATAVPAPSVVFRNPKLTIAEGNKIPLTQFMPTVANSTLNSITIEMTDGVSLFEGAMSITERTLTIFPGELSRYSIGMTSVFGYGDDQRFSLQARVTRLDGRAVDLVAEDLMFDVNPVAGSVVYNGSVSAEAFEGQAVNITAPFVLQHTEGESFAGVALSGVPDDVTVKHKVDGSFVAVILADGGTSLSLPADGRLDLQLVSQAARDFALRLVPQTNFGGDAPKTDHSATEIDVEFKAVPKPVVTFNDPGLSVGEGSQVALSQYIAIVQDGAITGYVLSVDSGTKIFRDGSAIAAASVTVPLNEVSRYSIGTPQSTDYGAKIFLLKPVVHNLRGDLIETTAEQRTVTFNPVAGSVSASGPSSIIMAEDTWKTITKTFTTEAGESVTAFRLGNVPSHMDVQYHNGNGFVNAARSGNTETMLVSGDQLTFRMRTATKGDFALTQQARLNFGASSTTMKTVGDLAVEVNCVLNDCSLMTCAEAKATAHAEGGNGCECISNSQNTINTNLGGPNGFIGGCKDSFCTDKYSALSECSRP